MSEDSSNPSHYDYAVSTTDSNGEKIRPGEDGTLYMDTRLKKEELAKIEQRLGEISASNSETSLHKYLNDDEDDDDNNDDEDDDEGDTDDNDDIDTDDDDDIDTDDTVGDENEGNENEDKDYKNKDDEVTNEKEDIEVSNFLTEKNLIANSATCSSKIKVSRSSASLSCTTTKDGSMSSVSRDSLKRSNSYILTDDDLSIKWNQFQSIDDEPKRQKLI